MTRGYNFGAGPATLPEAILHEVQHELLEWQETGMSILEIGHRTTQFRDLLEHTENKLRYLLNISKNYHVLFLGSAARMLFAMIPLNFLHANESAGYLVSGLWSKLAYTEAQKITHAYCIASGEEHSFTTIPPRSSWHINANTNYLYYTPNETVHGIYCPRSQLHVPNNNNRLPIIADMTSCLLTEPIKIDDYDLIFASAQKNLANAGLTVVIIRDDMLNNIRNNNLPTMLDFRTHVIHKSLYATPPTFNCYLANKMLHWIEQQGGVHVLYAINQLKAQKIYQFIDESTFYTCKVDPKYRSNINICFDVSNTNLENLFVKQATMHNLLALRGHSSVGGLRASIYNAMTMDGVDRLLEFMYEFAKEQQ
jgi:phosphoserine aminotransferase